MPSDLKLPMGDHELAELALAVSAGVAGYEEGAVVAKSIALLNAQGLVPLRAAVRTVLYHFEDSHSPREKQ